MKLVEDEFVEEVVNESGELGWACVNSHCKSDNDCIDINCSNMYARDPYCMGYDESADCDLGRNICECSAVCI